MFTRPGEVIGILVCVTTLYNLRLMMKSPKGAFLRTYPHGKVMHDCMSVLPRTPVASPRSTESRAELLCSTPRVIFSVAERAIIARTAWTANRSHVSVEKPSQD